MGFTNPDSYSHYSALHKFRTEQLEKNPLYQKFDFNVRYEVGQDLLNNWYGQNPDGRNNYIIYSEIKGETIGLFNNVWVLIDPKKFDITSSFMYYISKKIDELWKVNNYSKISDACSVIIDHFNGSIKYGDGVIRAGYFHSTRARTHYLLRNYRAALNDLSALKKNEVQTSYDYYTYYLIYDSYFGGYYDPEKAERYRVLNDKKKATE
jgi:hypothetical protein